MTDSNSDPEDTGQISVAELLARNGQKTSGASTGGRRRRGVKGGISVAELTGEIPVVRAEPASEKAPVIETPAQEPQKQESPTPDSRVEPELLSGSTTAAGDLLNKAHDAAEEQATPDKAPERRPYGSTASQRPVPVTQRRVDRTSGFVPRSRTTPVEPASKNDTEAEATAVQSAAVENKAPETRTAEDKTAENKTAEDKTAENKAPEKKAPETKAITTETPSARTPDLTEKPAASDDAVTEVTDAVVDEPDAPAATDRARDGKKDAAKQWAVLAGQGVIAIVVGALLFKGFESLWDMLPWVALVLAVLVIVGLVAVVRILRRTDDMISMVIAIAVGVFVTLGPLAFQLSTG